MIVSSGLGQTPLSSPLESPDVMQLLLPMTDMRATTATSLASMKMSSADSLPLARPPASILNQVRQVNRVASSNSRSSTTAITNKHTNPNIHNFHGPQASLTSHGIPNTPLRSVQYCLQRAATSSPSTAPSTGACRKSLCSIPETDTTLEGTTTRKASPLEFSLSSVGRSFFESGDGDQNAEETKSFVLQTPDTPSANLTPSSSSNRFSDKSFTDSRTHEYYLEMGDDEQEFDATKNSLKMMFDMKSKMRQESYCGSWDLLEIDLDFHEVNLDPSFGGDVQEYIFMGDEDPYGVLPPEPTKPDSLNL